MPFLSRPYCSAANPRHILNYWQKVTPADQRWEERREPGQQERISQRAHHRRRRLCRQRADAAPARSLATRSRSSISSGMATTFSATRAGMPTSKPSTSTSATCRRWPGISRASMRSFTWPASPTIPASNSMPTLGKSINYDCFAGMLQAAIDARVRRFIYASSSSIYGVKADANVREDAVPEPLTDYSKYKLLCEQVLLDHPQVHGMERVIVRPATVCGYAPRLAARSGGQHPDHSRPGQSAASASSAATRKGRTSACRTWSPPMSPCSRRTAS